MAFNGLGTFQLLYDWVQDRNNGIKILASRMMGQEQDIADGLSLCITVDGQSTITNTIPFANNQITLLASATTRGGAMNLGQFQDGSAVYASASGTNSYVAALDPAISAYPDGLAAYIYFPNANTAAATATLNLNGVGARNLVVGNGTLASAGTVHQGIGMVVARGTTWQYFPSAAPKGVFNMTDGGVISTQSSGDVNTSYLLNVSSTASLVFNFPSVAATGDTIPITVFGTGTVYLYFSGLKAYGTTSTVPSTGVEGFAMPRYTGTTRGWVW